jgi:hypothetical protein
MLLAFERAARAEAEVERTARVAAEKALAIRDELPADAGARFVVLLPTDPGAITPS